VGLWRFVSVGRGGGSQRLRPGITEKGFIALWGTKQ